MKVFHFAIALLFALLLAELQASGQPTENNEHDASTVAPAKSVPSARARFEPAKLFDFDNYKRIFKKTYSSLLEEVTRRKYFISRALRAFVSAIKYKYRQASYYLALNWMSDLSRNELDKMRNKVLERRSAPPDEGAAPTEVLAESEPRDEREMIEQAPRELPLERLLEDGSDAKMDPEVAEKIKLDVESNNPNYAGPNDYVCSKVGDQKKVSFHLIGPTEEDESLAEAKRASLDQEKPDEVFLDLRNTSKCFFMPRDQGLCGCCYAFAAIAAMEWLYCMKTGSLVAFSEQYMVDCGNAFVPYLGGCTGGDIYSVADFVRNFGLELRARYPFLMRTDTCPYQADTNLATTGYIRFEFDHSLSIHLDAFETALKNGPIALTISTAAGFQEYGGGVHGFGCDQEWPSHAVLLIGHGREDGLEYWLVRNSYSVGWGENGYYKLAKAANCIHPNYGNQYATKHRVVSETPRVEHNTLNDASIIRSHYAKNHLESDGET